MFYLEHFGITDAGKVRQNNEDAMLVGDGRDETLFAVADGIGGFEAGEVASSIAVDALKELDPGTSFDAVVQEANRRILEAARENEKLSGMGTTLVAVRFGGTRSEPVAEVAHVGDSRAYLLRGGKFRPLTEDHSLVGELVRSGDLTRAQAQEHPQKNLITRALGAEEVVRADTSVVPVEAGDRFVLCSDGLSDMVPESRIAEVLSASGDPETSSRRLLAEALEAGGTDNITVVIVDVKEQEPPGRQDRSGGTREMDAVSPPENADGSRHRSGAQRSTARKRKSSGFGRALGRLIRALAVVAVLLVALMPAYLWGGSRYFFAFDGNDVVLYRGLPYAPLGIDLNEEWRRTNLTRSDIQGPYREPIENHKLYTQDEAERVLRDLGRD